VPAADLNPDFVRVELADVSRNFGRRRALSKVSLAAQAGEIVGLLGPNGAGKSTLIAMLATLVTPTSGAVLYGGRRAADQNAAAIRGRIGLLAHELHLYPELSARQNLEFFGRCTASTSRRRCQRRSKPPVSRTAPTMRFRPSREVCVSAWRSSGLCCTSHA
jgi:ABC-type multidrug transport system ATPase subunit